MTTGELRAEVLRRLHVIGPRSVTASVVAHWGGEHLPTTRVRVLLDDLWVEGIVDWIGEDSFRLVVRHHDQTTLDVG